MTQHRHRLNWPLIILLAVWAIGVSMLYCSQAHAQTTRRYWNVPLDSLATGRAKHTHVAVTDSVVYTAMEADGDRHIRLESRSGSMIIAECIPELPCLRPAINTCITVYGISRPDPEHGWWEVHPVLAILPVPCSARAKATRE